MKIKSFTASPGQGYNFHCPGCNEVHSVWVVPYNAGGPAWTFNGDIDRPTFSPSLLVRAGHYAPQFKHGDDCWCTWKAKDPEKNKTSFGCYICHSFIRDGKIQFLTDCTHALAGQTVDIPDW